jgi:hypothetical protein
MEDRENEREVENLREAGKDVMVELPKRKDKITFNDFLNL